MRYRFRHPAKIKNIINTHTISNISLERGNPMSNSKNYEKNYNP